QHPAVRACVVTYHPEHKQLVAYVVHTPATPAGATPPDPATQLQQFLQAKLPSYMIPRHFLRLDALPLTPNGKIDRQALPPVAHQSTVPYVGPRTETEVRLSAIWQDVLGIHQIGIHESFVDAGGDSLSLLRLQTRIAQAFATHISLLDLCQFPTIAAQADHLIGGKQNPLVDIEIVPLRAADLDKTIEAVATVFVQREVLLVATGMSYDEFLPIAATFCAAAVDDGLSLIAKDRKRNAVVGFSICHDFLVDPYQATLTIPPKLEPIFALLEELEGGYRALHPTLKPGDLLYLFVMGSCEGYLGVGGLLQDAMINVAHAKNYKGLISSDTDTISQTLSAATGFTPVAEIDYQTFTYQTTTPFRNIEAVPSCKLMLKLL
ncbi:MAG: hypothetical protein KDE19_09440, partial [Caldilineaceae bacterium]|nr:hypothetical protein [Caldilineaceae bacterium]